MSHDWVQHYTSPIDKELRERGRGNFARSVVLGAYGGAVASINLLTLGALRRRATQGDN